MSSTSQISLDPALLVATMALVMVILIYLGKDTNGRERSPDHLAPAGRSIHASERDALFESTSRRCVIVQILSAFKKLMPSS
ncbi:hypothetical protein NUW54_g14738 [Trametes sanguinea]|uniref:Uncharacterized protein n=1 Tax=Trametes sanguinea TaxID=158606 RepID=A0ACC1MBI2_9APHY|nr:hypothetical protein NUW54_g14738 [Trametes sanguinea]